jgi:hypothetical protein
MQNTLSNDGQDSILGMQEAACQIKVKVRGSVVVADSCKKMTLVLVFWWGRIQYTNIERKITQFIIGAREGNYRCGLCQVEWRSCVQETEICYLRSFYTTLKLEVGRKLTHTLMLTFRYPKCMREFLLFYLTKDL